MSDKADQELAKQREALAAVETADEMLRQVILIGHEMGGTLGMKLRNLADAARESMIEAQREMIVTVYYTERKHGR